MARKSYSDKLKDPRWQKKRLEILSKHDFVCEDCCEKGKTVHVHHIFYLSGHEPWEYPDFVFVVLCEECHKSKSTENDFLALIGLVDDMSAGPTRTYWGVFDFLCFIRDNNLCLYDVRMFLEKVISRSSGSLCSEQER